MLLLLFLFSVLNSGLVLSSNSQYASVTYNDRTREFTIHDTYVQNSVANGSFKDEIFKTGWSYLEVNTDVNYPDPVQAYAAGVVEGYLTAPVLKNHWTNMAADYCNGEEAYCDRLKSFLEDNLAFININVETKRFRNEYWHQVALILEQLHGIEDGFRNITSNPSTSVDVMGLYFLNLVGDLIGLEEKLQKKEIKRPFGSGSCSALIKILPKKDIFFSHVTWTNYNSMLRILKKYSFQYHSALFEGAPLIPGHTYSFSSYPGLVFSLDDFYLISSGLAVMETSLENTNTTLWQYIRPSTILEFQRTIIANRLAKNGQQWTDIFSIMNSGTYNNQWMVLNYNKFQPNQPLQDGLLYVLEQLPNYIHSEEKTDVLRKQGFWSSYNVAYYEDIFNMSGAPENVKKYGDFFTHDKSPRALIFKRDQSNVTDIDSMMKLMRYNDYTNDPHSRCDCNPPYSADCAISARNDLNPANGTYPFESLGHSQEGGTDMKLTTYQLFQKLQFVAIGGPTYDPLPPFQWSKSDFRKTVKHEGHPDLWKFKPIIHKWT
ncbi:putative phospholipase B-like 2 [Parasteatoda tepidariorum]|uniref:putative phospholipase B-like 2 n=1 Tax=Parasteatoda tepidariorum TaxID=114398 RepID=UPI001C729593|nr:putative phospholipase B-like 2 [Parasteatoda tepidariorum]XP_042895279.1 putative phospholipase B-like 2 [Parasteatoda tepidariorum]